MSSVIKLQDKNEKLIRKLTDEINLIDKEATPIKGVYPLKKMLLSSLGVLPDGGTTGQVLKKVSEDDFDVEWGEGGGSAEERLYTGAVKVNENAETTIVGKIYTTLTSAIAYIVSEGCEADSPWTILIEGDYVPETEESISLPRGCMISGNISNMIGSNVTLDTPIISVVSENPTAVLLTTGLQMIIFKGKLAPTFKGMDPASGDTLPYMTGMTLNLVQFAPSEISGTGTTTFLLNSLYSSLLSGNYSGFVYNRALYSTIAPIFGDIIIDGYQFFHSNILSSSSVGGYGLKFMNTNTDNISYFMSNCYMQLYTHPSGETKVYEGSGNFWNCSIEIAWNGVIAESMYFNNCKIYGRKIGDGDFNVLQVKSNASLNFSNCLVGSNDNPIIELLTDTAEETHLFIQNSGTGNIGDNITVRADGGDGTAVVFKQDLSTDNWWCDANIDIIHRYGCLWDDADSDDTLNYYSAAKTHSLLIP